MKRIGMGLGRCLGLGAVAAALVFASAPPSLAGQELGTVTGRVTDTRDSSPLRGINVVAVGTRSAAVTDGQGRYVLAAVPAGSHTIRFAWLGYRDLEVTVDVPAGGEVVFDASLEAAPLEMGEIIVTAASRKPEAVLVSPAAVDVVNPARVRDLKSTGQVPLLFADLPGVQVMQSGVNSFNVNARGFNTAGTRRMLVLVDGIDMSIPIVGAQEWPATFVLEDRARVELVRGPGSALYGANAFSGVINITTPSARQARGTRISLSGGELSTFSADARHAGVSSDLRWGYSIGGGYSTSASWDRSRTDTGYLVEEYSDAVDGSLGGSAPPPGFELMPLKGQTKATPFGVPGPATGDLDPLKTMRASARVERYLMDGGVFTAEGGYSRLENQVGASVVSRQQVLESSRPWGRLAFGADDFSVTAYYMARTGEQLDLATGTVFNDFSSRLHLEGQIHRSLGERTSLVLGASARSETIDSKGTILAPRHDGRSDEYYAVFGQLDVDLAPSLKLTGAARFDDASLYAPEWSPKVGLLWTPIENQAFRVTYGRAYLMPTTAQRFLEFPLGPPLDLSPLEAGLRASPLGAALLGVPEGELFTNSAAVSALAIGNEELAPEEVASVEFGYKAQVGRAFVTADVHRSEFENFTTDVLPGVHPGFAPWTAPNEVPEAARGALEAAVGEALPGVTRFPDGTTALVFSNATAGRAIQWGLDLSTSLQVSDEVRVGGSYSYATVDFEDGSFLGADSVSTNTPKHTASVSGAYVAGDGTSVRLGLTLVDGFDFISGVWVGYVPGRQTLDLSAGYPLSDKIRIGLSVTNLLDQQRFHYFGGSLIGRRFLASLTWEP